MYFFVCSILKHQPNADILDENVLVFLMLFQCHQESAQFYIVLILLNIIFKHNSKKLLNSLEFVFVQCQGYENYCKVLKGVQKLFELF